MKIFTQLYKTDIPNRNGRIYPKVEVRKALADYASTIQQGKALGRLGQDDYSSCYEIKMDQVSHIITGYEEVDEGFLITAKILETPMGIVLGELLDLNAKEGRSDIVFGTASTGELEGNTVKNMKLISIDLIQDKYDSV